MKEKFKKIMVTTLVSMTAGTAIGCANTDSKIAKKINNGVNEFVSSINKLDYVDTSNSSSNLGKIVSAANNTSYFNKLAKNTNIENTITSPSERTDNFKLFVLSDTPYISLTSSDNGINLSMQFSTEKIENTSDDISEKINKLILKRAILMVYVNEIYSGNVELSDENRTAINAYVNVIKENASFLNGNRGMVKNQLGIASNLIENETNSDIINYYIIKSGEALEIRSNKIDSTISAIESIISILEQNLKPSSCYYQNNLTTKYDNMLANISTENSSDENVKLAKDIAESINLIESTSSTNQENSTSDTSVNNQTTLNNQNTNTLQRNTTRNLNNQISNNTNKNIQNNLNRINLNENKTSNEIATLDEKTQNNPINSENPQNSSNLNENLNNLTPSQRARIRRLNRQRNNNQTNSNTNTSTINQNNNDVNQNYNFQDNKTARADRTRNTNQDNTNYPSTNHRQTSNVNNRENAVRVPYRTTSINL